jgi:hypothetical protein
VIPLGELFTIKRNGKYKFRQIALGNLLKEGKDCAETFASTISGDGIRWFCAIAASCGRKIYGWDAKTGYLLTKQRIPIYAYELHVMKRGPPRKNTNNVLKNAQKSMQKSLNRLDHLINCSRCMVNLIIMLKIYISAEKHA